MKFQLKDGWRGDFFVVLKVFLGIMSKNHGAAFVGLEGLCFQCCFWNCSPRCFSRFCHRKRVNSRE